MTNDDLDRSLVANERSPLLTDPPVATSNGACGEPKPNGLLNSEISQSTQEWNDSQANDSQAASAHHAVNSNRQILLLCFCSLADPVAYFAIFPFINEMIERVGRIPKTDVGFYSGLIESLFSLVQMLLMIVYGRLSDRLGRKPVLVFSLAGIAVTTALFGMSQSLWQMAVIRSMCGLFAGSAVTIRTMLSENCTKENEGRAFSWYMFVRNLGIFVGPLIGGPLANPAEQFPGLFNSPFWTKYPYALSTWTAGGVVLFSAIVAAMCLDETLKVSSEIQENAEPLMTTWEVLKSPGVPMVLAIYGYVGLLSLLYTAVSPVFWYTPVELGGFGFSDQKIAIFIALAGASQALWMLVVFPTLHKRIGNVTILQGCSFAFPTFMAMYPFLNEILRYKFMVAFWILGPFTIIIGSGAAMMFTCTQLLVNHISPSSRVLGTMNALALTVSNAIRAFAPILGTSVFALSIKWGFADGHMFWIIIVALSTGLVILCRFVPERAAGCHSNKPQEGPRSSETECDIEAHEV